MHVLMSKTTSTLEFTSLMSIAWKLSYEVTRGMLFLIASSLGKHVSQNWVFSNKYQSLYLKLHIFQTNNY